MIHPTANIILLTLILRVLVIVSLLLRLLLRSLPLCTIVVLTRCVLDIPLGAVVSIVPGFTTPVTSVLPNRSRVGIPHGCTGGSILAVLREVGAWCLLSRAWSLRSLLILALVLVLSIVDIRASRTERRSLWRCKARAAVA